MRPSFTVVTLNIWNRGDPWDARLALILAGMRALDPDVVALQEVVQLGDEFDQARQIADGLGYHHVCGRHPESAWPFGNAVLSRWPIARSDVALLPSVGTDERRALVYAEIASPFGTIPMFTTHLNWKLDEGHVRAQQIRFVADRVGALVSAPDRLPPVVAGDLNAEPEADEIRFMRGYTALGGACVYFADCFALAGDGSPGHTFCRRNAYAAVAHEPDRRIDYVFVRGPDDRRRGEPLEARVCFDQPTGDVWPSDHFGVWARISA
jgi:endonuclease/exonuclease/phosphatase family metal-dependent hydrolase